MLTLQDYTKAAATLGCEVAAIRAVDKVESNGAGFLKSGEPVILFEPHIFYKELRKAGLDPVKLSTKDTADILYPVWGTKPYGPASAQHARLQRAIKIHREAALKSASWGRFQICGFNYKLCGCKTLQEFINKIYQSETVHLELFVNYIQATNLDDELQNKDWKGFARGYNGSLYTKNRYDSKLKAAYELFLKGSS